MTVAAPTLVLLPGLDGTGVLFDEIVAALGPATRTSVIAHPDECLGYAELEALVRGKLPTDGPFVVLGESFSGPIAVSIAASPPPGLRGIILCCSFLRTPRPVLSMFHPVSGMLPTRGPAVSLAARALLGRFTSPRLLAARDRVLALVSPETYRHRLASVSKVDATAAASRVRLPSLYLRATADRVVPRSASKLVARHLPGIRIVEVEGPHMLLQASAAAAAREIATFLADVATTGAADAPAPSRTRSRP